VLVAGAATLVVQLPFAVGTGVFIGAVAGEVYRARRQGTPIPWAPAAVQGAAAGVAACLVLWLLRR